MNALGRHIIVELFDGNPAYLDDVNYVQEAMQNAAQAVGATIINVTFHHFSPYGVSGVIVIQESHLAIHTWPEWGFASIDLFTCGDTIDPWKCYAILKAALGAAHGSAIEMRRGQLDLLQKNDYSPRTSRPDKPEPVSNHKITREIWFTERDENLALSLKHQGNLLFKAQSNFQKIEIFETYAFGKALVLDGLVVATEKDEAAYHEMLVHPAMNWHKNPKRVLIIGGGDGGTAREVLRHPEVEEVVMIEQDELVTQAAKTHFESLALALSDPKLEIIFEDAQHYLKNNKYKNEFDLILVDASDTSQKPILNSVFFEMLYQVLASDGVLATQCDAPRWHQKRFLEIIQSLRSTFKDQKVHPYLSYVASLPTGMCAFACVSKSGELSFQTIRENKSLEENLFYYNTDLHRSAFELPTFLKKLLQD